MTIEFRCHMCQKLLRTADEKAGRMAKCPGCGEQVTVPAAVSRPQPAVPLPEEEPQGGSENEIEDDGPDASKTRQRFTPASRPCPLCGELNAGNATACQYCGESFPRTGAVPSRAGARATFDAGEVISASWEIFKSSMSGCMISSLIVNGINAAAVLMLYFFIVAGFFAVAGQGNQNPDAALIVLMIAAFFIGMIVITLVSAYVYAGYVKYLLKLVRGEDAELGELFSGGYFFWRMLAATFIFNLVVGLGMQACYVGGIIILLMWWPYGFCLVDRDLPGIRCLNEAGELTKNNWGQGLLLGLAAAGINFLGALTCLGLFVTVPLTTLYMPVAYCRMTDQRTIA